jgi:ABC transporter with metal-binding/Fe-S-binding domain ATP-binding protein
MKLGILLSGGKDSLYAAYKAQATGHELACCLTIQSENEESYMFHTPNISGVHLQAEAMELPLLTQITPGEKEVELEDLRTLLKRAKQEHHIEGITTGAVGSQYQAARIQSICYELNLYCFNPLWQINQVQLLEELLEHKFKIIFTGVFAYPLDEEWLGRELTAQTIEELKLYEKKYRLNPAGEGGELESYVLDCPLFKKQICIDTTTQNFANHAGTYTITKAHLEDKEQQTIIPLPQHTTTQPAKILIISTVAKELALHEEEFVRPILARVQKSCRVVPVSNIPDQIPETHIIITGCAILDDQFLTFREKVQNLLTLDKPILGICAGAELLLPEGHDLQERLEIGPQKVEELHTHPLVEGVQEAFFLHHLGMSAIPFESPLQGLLATKQSIAAYKYLEKEIYGIQFHPEVGRHALIQRFLQL